MRSLHAAVRSSAILAFQLGLAVCLLPLGAPGQTQSLPRTAQFFVDCSAAAGGDGSSSHPWNTLDAAGAHSFQPGELLALRRGTVCHGSFAPHGAGSQGSPVRMTAYGAGPRPRIQAASADREALLLFNLHDWQIDSLEIAGSNTYGVFVSGDEGVVQRITLRNLYVHDVYGGAMKNKDNGLVVVGPSSPHVVLNDIQVEGVDVAHTSLWSGILAGGGPFPYPDEAPLNRGVRVRNSTASDVQGDGIVLFRVEDGVIESSAAWQTGMQHTETIGTPNAIWTWTCTRCTVADNEAFLTDSPGVDGGAFDIDWNDHSNVVERNFAHDTQGYCVALFAAAYKTTDSVIRENLCVNNGLSPRLAALQGAIYLHTMNHGVAQGLVIEQNTIDWHPQIPEAPVMVSDVVSADGAPVFARNTINSTTPWIYRVRGPLSGGSNVYRTGAEPLFTVNEHTEASLAALQAAGLEPASRIETMPAARAPLSGVRLEAAIDPALDADGLLEPVVRGQLLVLRTLACEYSAARLRVIVHLPAGPRTAALENALEDLGGVCPGVLNFVDGRGAGASGTARLVAADGSVLHAWTGFRNAAELTGTVRGLVGAPDYQPLEQTRHAGAAR